jgi:hypothetical protein
MGIRLKAGTMMRIFEPNADPRGQPVAWDSSEDPMVPRHFQAPVLPQVLGTHSLDKVAPLATLPELTPQDAVDLVRAARFYQDALWMVESTPELSWLMLVSAIEIAAGRWRVNKASPLERLRFSKPDLVAHLEEAGGSALAQEVATEFADSMGVTQNFVDFIIEFLPNPPEIRPPEVFQYPWTREALTRAMKRIYNWRSKALHSGIPFPAPMCRPAHKRHEGGFVERATIGAAMGTRGGVWQDKDAPMALHLFEYITRGCLLKWWESLVPSSY